MIVGTSVSNTVIGIEGTLIKPTKGTLVRLGYISEDGTTFLRRDMCKMPFNSVR